MDLFNNQERFANFQTPSPRSSLNSFLTLNESRAVNEDTKSSAFSPYQKTSACSQQSSPYQKNNFLEPFNGEQDFLEDAQRYFSSFFNQPGHPDDALLAALPPFPSLPPETSPPAPLTKPELAEMQREHVMPLRGPPSQVEMTCYCHCCVLWKLYFNPLESEKPNQRQIPDLCYCACCRKWDMYLHFIYNCQIFGYYNSQSIPETTTRRKAPVVRRTKDEEKTKKRKYNPRKIRNKVDNKENLLNSKKRKEPARFSQQSLLKKDNTLKLNTTFQPQIPYLTPLDS